MNWLLDPDRVKVQWRLVYMNLAAVVLNITIGIVTLRWMSIANFISALFSLWFAYKLWARIPEITREQEQRILTILKGR